MCEHEHRPEVTSAHSQHCKDNKWVVMHTEHALCRVYTAAERVQEARSGGRERCSKRRH